MNMIQKMKLYACILIAAMVGCYGIEPGATTSTMNVSSADSVVTVTIPAGTVLYTDIGKTVPAEGTPSASVYNLKFISQGGTVPGSASTYKLHETINPLAVYAQLSTDTSKASDGSGVFFDIEITVDSIAVKSIAGTIRANVKLPTGYATTGNSVYYYSYGKGVIWTKEGKATVKPDGSIDIKTSNLSLAVTNFIDWVPPGNGKLPQGTYPVSGSPFGQFTFVIGASPAYIVSAKNVLGEVIPVTVGSIVLQSGSTALYDFTAIVNNYTFIGVLDKVSGKIAGN